MKTQLKFTIKSLIVAALISTVFSSCKDDYFLLPDRNGMDARIWDNEGAIQYHLNDTYDVVMPDFPYEVSANNILYASDENYKSATDGNMRKVLGLQGSMVVNDVQYIASKYQGTKGDNRYYDIARCNNAIKYIPEGTLTDEVKRKFLGQYYALRAMVYFSITRLYGGVPIVLEPQNPDNLTLQGRAKAADCFKQIVSDLDSAIVKLEGVTWDDGTGRGKWTKEAAMAYKARVLLYWASPLFNPENDPAHPYDASRWQTALQANKEAYDACVAAGKKLMANYSEIFLREGTANTEAIIVRSYSNKLAKRGNSVEAKSRPRLEGGSGDEAYVASSAMVDAYLMSDGTKPSISNPLYDPILFWRNRDPRFAKTLVTIGDIWELSGKAGRRQWTYENEVIEGSAARPFYCRRFSNSELAAGSVPVVEDFGGNGTDWIELRFAEVMLNYAECLNATGDITGAKNLVRQIRQRAGIVAGSQDYGLGLAANTQQMKDLIANERMVEFAFEGMRSFDLRRNRTLHLLTGTLTKTIFEPLNNDVKKNLETEITINGVKMYKRDTLNLTRKGTFQAFFKYPRAVVTPGGNGPYNVPSYYYFYPLPNTFMNSSPLLEQTVGWDIGTFDPL